MRTFPTIAAFAFASVIYPYTFSVWFHTSFSIAHELRHIWQIKYNEKFYLETYKTIDLCYSVEEYNLQPAEIDANAFAYIVMVDFFGIKPLFNGLSDTVKSKIMERVEYLKDVL